MKALILSLATARLTQLFVDDEITEPVRDAVSGFAEGEPKHSLAERLETAINCHACTSIWAGAGILVAEQTGIGRFLVRTLALSQAALTVKAVIERIDR